jgi:murein DD-endopeptidase MepM/ murein hydrolase activator NlpD
MEKMSSKRKILVFLFLIFLIFLNSEKEKVRSEKETYPQTPFTLSQTWQALPEFVFVNNDSLFSYLPPAFVSGKTFGTRAEETEQRKEILEYVVEEGDTLASIAQKFGISLETLLWANNLNKNSNPKPGTKLIILPVDGVLHQVKSGETLSEIAKKYQAKVEDIVAFNELEGENDIYIGDILVIPGGKMPPPPKPVKKKFYSPPVLEIPSTSLANGYFICPVAGGCRITQGLHFYNAVDFSNGKCGEPVLAAAGGTVLKVKSGGWNGGAGTYVKILHPNGVVTMYAHLQAIFVSPGQQVSQGQIIGLMGATGKATGCHLHFDVFGAKNPFVK